MPSHPLSMKKTRYALAKTVDQVNAQAHILARTAGVVNLHTRILSAGFFGRLRWLLFGRVPEPKTIPAEQPVD